MTDKEAIKYLQQLYPNGGHCWLDYQRIEAVGMAIKALQKKPVSEHLDTLVEEEWLFNEKIEVDCLESIPLTKSDLSALVHKIANWQKEQLMAKAVNATVHIDAGGYPYIPQMEIYDYDKDIPLAKEGDKYKVILIKEE